MCGDVKNENAGILSDFTDATSSSFVTYLASQTSFLLISNSASFLQNRMWSTEQSEQKIRASFPSASNSRAFLLFEENSTVYQTIMQLITVKTPCKTIVLGKLFLPIVLHFFNGRILWHHQYHHHYLKPQWSWKGAEQKQWMKRIYATPSFSPQTPSHGAL